jgi:hypothetical protein
MVLIEGEKWACLRCIRGHRVSSCQHQDRELHHVAKKGRPISQCAHCRHSRKGTRASHLRCGCGERLSRCKHLQHPLNGHDEKCCRNHGALCSCLKQERSTVLINMRSEGRSIGSSRAMRPGDSLARNKWRIPSPSSPITSHIPTNSIPLICDDKYIAELDHEVMTKDDSTLIEKGICIGDDGHSDSTTRASSPVSAEPCSSEGRLAFKPSSIMDLSGIGVGAPLSSTEPLMASGALTAAPFSTMSGTDLLASLSFNRTPRHISCQPSQCDGRRSSPIVGFQNVLSESGQVDYASHMTCVKSDGGHVSSSPYQRCNRQGQCDVILSDASHQSSCKEHLKLLVTQSPLPIPAIGYDEQQVYWIQSGFDNIQPDMLPTCFLFESDQYVC